MAYHELIKNFDGIRAYMRAFYVYGFKSRTEYSEKSARSYDNERRRMDSWLGACMSFHQEASGKCVFLSVDSRRIARTIVDTLSTEALIRVQLSYSFVITSLTELPEAFRETSLALKVGKLFYSEQTVFPYNELGIGRLIYQLPVSLCENFLKEIFGSDVPEAFDDETLGTINRFFQNNLNIAETSRQLHMHRNTLIYRLEQIEKRTGLDVRLFEDAMTFKIAIMVLNYLQSERNH